MSEHHDVIVIGSGAGGFVDGRYISEDSWYDVKGKSFFQPQVHYFVGGATKLYGAALYRMRAEDFGELKHHDGISPPWPRGMPPPTAQTG